jgi:hypothetical protein
MGHGFNCYVSLPEGITSNLFLGVSEGGANDSPVDLEIFEIPK